MIEDGFIDKDLSISRTGPRDAHGLARPHVPRHGRRRVARPVHRDRSCSGSSCASRASTPTRPASKSCGGDEIGAQVLDRWEQTLHARSNATRRSSTASSTGSRSGTCCARTSTATTLELERPEAVAARPPVPRRAPGPVALREARARRARSSAWWTRPTCARRWSIRPRPPAPISAARASHAGPIRWSPPTGTASCSTSAATRCGGSR